MTVGLLAIYVGIARADVLNMPAGQTSIDLVWVADNNNPNDSTGYGSVGYAYQMDKYEVTNAQYCQFLNGVLPTINSVETGTVLLDDRYGVYNRWMETQVYGGINYDPLAATNSHFSVKSGYENKPVVYVSWYDSVRFANWLQNGQGSGSTETGTYTITGGGKNSGTVAIPDAATRATWDYQHKHWVLPSENEWYKAAYYQPAAKGGDTDGYWDYATATNLVPYSDNPLLMAYANNSANYYNNDGISGNGVNDGYAVGPPYLTNVGAYSQSLSYYGTYDQAGNVWEWNEAIIIGSYRGVRGGSWYDDSFFLAPSCRIYGYDPSYECSNYGFRVASVPEPGSITLLLAGAVAGLIWWRRRGGIVL